MRSTVRWAPNLWTALSGGQEREWDAARLDSVLPEQLKSLQENVGLTRLKLQNPVEIPKLS